MLTLGLVGRNISHSKSQEIYESILKKEIRYSLLDYSTEKEISTAEELLNTFDGISITSPYKEHFVSEVKLPQDVLKLNATNCLRRKNNVIEGTNTDYLALNEIIHELNSKGYKYFIILGSGAMARVCQLVLNSLNLSFESFSRQKEGDITQIDLSEFNNTVVINTCAREYVFSGRIGDDSLFFDLNYGHLPHLSFFNHQKSHYIDGLALLELQARYALKFWGID